jgi:serine protease AprX
VSPSFPADRSAAVHREESHIDRLRVPPTFRPAPLEGRARRAAIAAIVVAALGASLLQPAVATTSTAVGILVREVTPASDAAERLVERLGGHVTLELPIVDGFAASVPRAAVPALLADASVAGVSADARLRMASTSSTTYDALDPDLAWRKAIRLNQIVGITGHGVAVALLDTGVSQVEDLGDRVVARVDFTPGAAGFDTYGHGTHLAGIIGGNGAASDGKWRGVAPGAQIVSVKVAAADGSTDVSVVIAALQWIVTHRDEYGIRVLNIAFGTDGDQPYALDPLDAAVERAWAAGITVVVSAGNRGSQTHTINKPGDDPYVITVGAADLNGTSERNDDVVAPFSSRGPTQDGFSKPDVVAPGLSIVSTRSVGSTIDKQHPDAVVDADYFKGTGTSQATAVVSGLVALMYEANPSLKPNAVKGILMGTAYKTTAYRTGGGAGLVDASGAVQAAASGSWVNPNAGLVRSDGSGSLEASRGGAHVQADLDGDGLPELVQGEVDVLGDPWDSTTWSSTSWSSTSWSSTSWSSLISENEGWSSTSWSSTSWSGTSWSSTSWSSTSWSSTIWSSTTWSSASWG